MSVARSMRPSPMQHHLKFASEDFKFEVKKLTGSLKQFFDELWRKLSRIFNSSIFGWSKYKAANNGIDAAFSNKLIWIEEGFVK